MTDNRAGVFLVPMNGGIWTLCIDLTAEEIREMSNDGFPQVDQCVNYLAGTMESAQGNDEDARADWQHSESQASLHPHLSRYSATRLISLLVSLLLFSSNPTFSVFSSYCVCVCETPLIVVTGKLLCCRSLQCDTQYFFYFN